MPQQRSTPAATAAIAPETSFQALTRADAPALSGPVRVDTPLAPIVEQALDLIDATPDAERQHDCWDGSWSSIWVSYPPTGPGQSGRPCPALDRLPALTALFEELAGTVGSVVIARLAPGDLLDWHYDPVPPSALSYRLHLPIRSGPDAVTEFCHERVHWPVGGLYYGEYGYPHRVFNLSGEDRIHLYFDVTGPGIAERLPDAVRAGFTPAGERLRQAAVNEWLHWRATPRVAAGPVSAPG
jgi:hypothetical protein